MPASASAACGKSEGTGDARPPPAPGKPPARRHSLGFVAVSAVLLWMVIWRRVPPTVDLRHEGQAIAVDAELPAFFEWSQVSRGPLR